MFWFEFELMVTWGRGATCVHHGVYDSASSLLKMRQDLILRAVERVEYKLKRCRGNINYMKL